MNPVNGTVAIALAMMLGYQLGSGNEDAAGMVSVGTMLLINTYLSFRYSV